ncbi:MAG: hypothetical protein WBK91_08210 [Alphaproteobacteria bacterium]
MLPHSKPIEISDLSDLRLAARILARAVKTDLAGVNVALREVGLPPVDLEHNNQEFTWVPLRDLKSVGSIVPQIQIASDFLRGADHNPLLLNFTQAVTELTRRNGTNYNIMDAELRNEFLIEDIKTAHPGKSWMYIPSAQSILNNEENSPSLLGLLKEKPELFKAIQHEITRCSDTNTLLRIVTNTTVPNQPHDVYHAVLVKGAASAGQKRGDQSRAYVVPCRIVCLSAAGRGSQPR